MKKLVLLLVVMVLLSSVAYADIFGPQPGKTRAGTKAAAIEGLSLDPLTLLEYFTAAVNYLGAREGAAYDFNAKEFCNYAGATLYTYQPWNLALDIGLINTDGGAATLDWNAGKMIPAESVPILSVFKYLYIGGGVGARYLDNTGEKNWRIAPIIDGQFKGTF